MDLLVQGMTCEGCAGAVRRSVAKVAPDAKVKVELKAGKVQVEGKADRAAVIAAIEKAGFSVAR
ncbi:MAG: heavy-metal-associated domain-containing protein [Alphaproteobacteria bacterium]|nr:heavy-metal-associated domain-containing protein [Alphaproteobacteria bacterium]